MATFDLTPFFAALLVIIGGAAGARWVVARFGQPRVLGEILLGLALGPGILGWAWPDAHAYLFAGANALVLEALANIGLVLFMYLVGSELQWTRAEAGPTFLVALGGLLLPFGIGAALASSNPNWFFPHGPNFAQVVVLGTIMSVSALAVLARLLGDLGLQATRVGAIAMGAATIDDVVGWVLLGLVAGIGTVGLLGNVGWNALLLLGVALVAVALDRYLAPRFARRNGNRVPLYFFWLLVAIFVSALLTHWAGLHAVIGPFVVGAIASRHAHLRAYAQPRLGGLTLLLLLPSFFVLSGAAVDLRLLASPASVAAVLVVLGAGTLAKLGGAYVGARAAGLGNPEGLQLGVLLNARGAVGLVVASVAYTSGLISAHGYALLVVMIVVSTMLAPILLRALAPQRAPVQATGAPEI